NPGVAVVVQIQPTDSLLPDHGPKMHEHTDPSRRLRARRERPRGRRTAEQSDELASLNAGYGDFLPCRVASAPAGIQPAGDDARFTAPSSCRRTGGRSLG